MKLIASLIVRNEFGRYLQPCIRHLLEFCDEVRVLNDASDDGTVTYLAGIDRVEVASAPSPMFFAHEGQARQTLLNFTLQGRPTHVLAIDADEFVSDGQALRRACEVDAGNGVWTLSMEEVWKADFQALWLRMDGGWRKHPVPIVYRVPLSAHSGGLWKIQDRQLACGREPLAVRQTAARGTPLPVSCLHFGWTNQAERMSRYQRYAVADGGKFHASSHLASILAPDARVRIARRMWPEALAGYQDELLERTARLPEAA